ncbi:ketosteroid isomerase-related protein [Sinorhizobium meliloti]|uniref:ketosteroid isomerase-related protein n=1 Tax=Rhizobium meliloti TaxID=382 RepID=UPI000FD8B252|nr:ketosteroid isomerase-related protein [Sinorhizobium meliloti]RVG72761.1 hypothetical protein CN220_10250 [Sinorhizobium meliloti]RVH44834.1 hypothetical protein CN212_24140 [Sinorhizobium meliloti]RVO70245.1 hypothetical protein CN087_07910 [Sinorhizobium meliloti]
MTDAQTIASHFIEALNDRDFDTLSRLVGEDVAFDSLTGERTLGAGALRSWVMNYFRHFDESFSDVVLMRDAAGERVAADTTARGTYRETMAGFPEASGQAYSIASVFVFEIEDGLIARLSHYRNSRLFERELAG